MQVPLFLFFALVQISSILVVSPSFYTIFLIARFRNLVTRGLCCSRFVRTLHVFPTWLLVFVRVRFQAVFLYPFFLIQLTFFLTTLNKTIQGLCAKDILASQDLHLRNSQLSSKSCFASVVGYKQNCGQLSLLYLPCYETMGLPSSLVFYVLIDIVLRFFDTDLYVLIRLSVIKV